MFRIIKLLFFFLIFIPKLNAENITESQEISGVTRTAQQHIKDDADITFTITNSTISRANYTIKINTTESAEANNATIVISSDSTVKTTTGGNAIYGNGSDGLTVNNSGTVSSSESTKAIDLANSTGATITNNSGGSIYANGRTISVGASDTATINNYGKIYSTTTGGQGNTIYSTDNTETLTLTNHAGGEITNNSSSKSTLRIRKTSTITNSGTIKNNQGPSATAIELYGSNNTLTLKDSGIVVGIIESSGTNNTLKLQHGVGQSYFYETSGNFTLEDLDGNNVVKGSAGSVGQGGNEFIDESLGYKSLNIRKSLTQFKISDQFLDRDTAWVETFSSLLKRDGKSSSLKLENSLVNFGANIIKPLENLNFVISAETSLQNISKDHDVDRISILSGFYFNNHQNNKKLKGEYFILGGIGLNKSERLILTNTTSSGLLNVTDNYENFEILFGNKLNNSFLIPDIGYTLGYSYTPSHKESKYFDWDDRHVLNISAALSDEYTFFQTDKRNFSLGWILDYRTLANNDDQNYLINGTRTFYDQDNELKKEASFSSNLNYKYKANENSIFSFNLDGLTSSQDSVSLLANLIFKFKI